MSNTVIKVDNLGKKYTIRHEQKERYTALRDVLARGIKNAGKRLLSPFTVHHSPFTSSQEDFWALKNVSFEVKQGEKIGIIGRNGAGKSTLLKILSRITEPTTGRIKLRGKVASLLEVGTGFHPELTGRENIYLNGAILGMTKAEIKRKFDEIVFFSEIEKFLDTPVKRYSSGMYVRLAFAVAAHLEPEILIVDEVLAVGDAQFQKKCIGKMDEIGNQGRTVLFVSHNLAMVTALTTKAVLLADGRAVEDGPTGPVIDRYMRMMSSDIDLSLSERTDRKGSGNLVIVDFAIEDAQGSRNNVAVSGQEARFVIRFKRNPDCNMDNVIFSFSIESLTGEKLLLFANDITGDSFSGLPLEGNAVCTIPKFPLIPGIYRITVWARRNQEFLDWISPAAEIQVMDGDFFGTGRRKKEKFGPFLAAHSWVVESVQG